MPRLLVKHSFWARRDASVSVFLPEISTDVSHGVERPARVHVGCVTQPREGPNRRERQQKDEFTPSS